MLDVVLSNRFKKDLKLAKKRHPFRMAFFLIREGIRLP